MIDWENHVLLSTLDKTTDFKLLLFYIPQECSKKYKELGSFSVCVATIYLS